MKYIIAILIIATYGMCYAQQSDVAPPKSGKELRSIQFKSQDDAMQKAMAEKADKVKDYRSKKNSATIQGPKEAR
jgi:hypothetical protein